MGALPGTPPRNYTGLKVMGGTLGAVAAASVLFGRGMLDDQVVANAYTSAATTAAPLGANPSSINSLARYQAFGTAGRNLNSVSFNTQDAAQGAASLAYIGGYVPGMQMGANGRAVNSAFNAIGLANPGLGAAGSAALTGQVYSQSTALRMQQLGYRTTPRTMNGGWNNMATNVQSLLQRWYGSKSVDQKSLVASLSAGGVGAYNLQALGYNPQQIQQLTPVIETYNKLSNAGLSNDRANSLIQRATRGSQSSMLAAQDELASKYGIQKSDLQALKDKSAVRTGNLSDISGGYNSALQESVKLLGQFNQMLNDIMRTTHTTGLLGGAAGVGGALSTIAHGGELAGGAYGALRIASLLKGGGKLLEGKGAADTLGSAGGKLSALLKGRLPGIFGGAAEGGAAAAEGGAAAAGAEGLAAGAGPIGLGALTVFGLGKFLLDHTDPNTAPPPGFSARFGPGAWGGTRSQRVNVGGGAGPSTQNTNKTKQNPGKGNKQTVGGSVSGPARSAVNAAETRLGDPYVFGADGPNAFDCSGLVEWSYKQAGVQLPRTSQGQWFGLKDRRVSLNNVQEGDIVFAAGSDGTSTSPGHEAMMINQRMIIEASHTGAPVAVRPFNPHEWIGAARPRGSVAGQGGPRGGGPGTSNQSGSGIQGNTGRGGLMGGGVGFGSTEATTLGSAMSESEMLAGGGTFAGSLGNVVSNNNGGGSSTGGGTGPGGGRINHGRTGNLKGNRAIMNKWASKYGWGTGKEWGALVTLEMHEAGFNNLAQNPRSTAFGMGQFLDSTWASVGGHKTSDPNLQSDYMMRYIKQRYHDPVRAWAQYYNHAGGVGWYGHGGKMRAGELALVGDRGPELVAAGKDGATVMSAARTSELLSGSNSMTQQMGSLNTKSHHAGSSVTLNFGPGSVVLGTVNGSYNDSANAARVFIRKLRKELENEHVYMVIAEGGKN
jgi:hypothetical protein